MKKLIHLTLCASLVTVLCISLASCDRFNTWLDNPVTIYINLGDGDGNGTGEGAGEGKPSITLTPEQIAETKAVLTEAQKEGSKISIEFTYKGIDYAAGFEKQNDLDYKLVMFTSNKTSTLDETLALAKFTPYLITRFPDSWTDEEAEDYLKALGISDDDDEGDDDDSGADSGDDDDDEGVVVNDDEADAVEGEKVPDDGDDDEGGDAEGCAT